jgi:hypothetical protein
VTAQPISCWEDNLQLSLFKSLKRWVKKLLWFFLRRPIHPLVDATNLINPLLYKHNTGSSAFSYLTLRPGIFIGISFHVIHSSITLCTGQLLIYLRIFDLDLRVFV